MPMRTIPESAVWMAAPHSPQISPQRQPCGGPSARPDRSLPDLSPPPRRPSMPPTLPASVAPAVVNFMPPPISPNRQISSLRSSPLRILELFT